MRINPVFKTIASFAMVFILLSCSDPSPKLTTPNANRQQKTSERNTVVDSSPVKVDVLIVIANDSSMVDHESNLMANAGKFTSQLFKNKLIDFHIGVVNAIADDQHLGGAWGGRLSGAPKFIDPSTPNPVTALQANMNVGHDAADPVALFTVVEQALTSPIADNENAGFLRPDADLAVMFLSDTDPEDTAPAGNGRHAADFYKFLISLKNNDPQKISVYAAYAPNIFTCQGEDNAVEINALLKLTQPKAYGFNLCDPNFGNQLANISNRIASSIKTTFYLSRLPVVATIIVSYGGLPISNDPDTGWTYDPSRNRLQLGPHLVLPTSAPGSKIEISYEIADQL